MARRRKYPEASSKYNYYNGVARQLRGYETAIKSAVAKTKISSGGNLVSTSAIGDYYNEYIAKKDDWIAETVVMTGKFNGFLSSLASCISRADAKATLWHGRINEMEDVK